MKTDPRKNLNDYARYSGMAVQMLVIILAGVFAGYKLDQWLQIRPVLTVIFSIVSVALSIYIVTRDLLRK
jgi:F0F1-type ATP synthase assembly protein I